MRKVGKFLIITIVIIFLVVISLQSVSNTQEVPEQINIQTLAATPQGVLINNNLNINDLPLKDNLDLYQYDQPGSIVYMYVTIHEGNRSDNTDHTWQEVNDFTKYFYTDVFSNPPTKAEVIFQIGDENGPLPGEIGYSELVSNATINVRGSSTTQARQKSYKIEFFDRAGFWRGQSTLALNKHPYDLTRVRNKLCFDLIKKISHMVSLQTQFVNLLVKDETTDLPDTAFNNLGLFTQVEQPNRRFLENHLLDRNGQLYKATFFEFFRSEDQLRLADDPFFDEKAFSSILEIKGNRDHTKLIAMLDSINNWSIPIEQTFDKYFDADNYFTWLAFNILVGNMDTQTQNFYLYSPQNGDKWYFLPWDYDGALDRQARVLLDRTYYSEWENGISNYWGTVLHKRILRIEKYRIMLDDRIKELKNILTPDLIRLMLEEYQPAVNTYINKMPDLLFLPGTPENHTLIYSLIPEEIQLNYDLYLESLEKPMPFFLGIPEIVGDTLVFTWDAAYDFDAQDIQYSFQVSRDWEFIDLVAEQGLTNMVTTQIPILEPGNYFWRVIATNEDGKTQIAFDKLIEDVEGNVISGIKSFYITPEGEILEQTTQELP